MPELTAKPASRCREGKCLKCGYDLTGLSEPRCPECATPFTPAAVLQPLEGAAEPQKTA